MAASKRNNDTFSIERLHPSYITTIPAVSIIQRFLFAAGGPSSPAFTGVF